MSRLLDRDVSRFGSAQNFGYHPGAAGTPA
jgi:hypothetical protein